MISGNTARFSYDADGVRRKRLDANGTIHYVSSYERNIGTGCLPLLDGVVVPNPETITKYYAAQFGALSRVVAVRKSGSLVLGSPQLSYVGCDHLGGPTRWTDPSFNVVDARLNPPSGVLRQMQYTPYGVN